MPHQVQNVSDYHAGDALDISVTVEDPNGSSVDLSNASAEWLLKENADDADGDALLTKDTDGGGITITDALNGEMEISIETGDTTGMNGQKHHRCRVTDEDGDRVTVFTGSFTIEV